MYVAIYGLFDPRTNQLRYVGRSKNAQQRYRQHLDDAKKYLTKSKTADHDWFALPLLEKVDDKTLSNHNKLRWIAELLNDGNAPQMKMLDEWKHAKDIQDANRLEDAYIAIAKRDGALLFNYIYSHRQSHHWYHGLRGNTPEEYVKNLKDGIIVDGSPYLKKWYKHK